MIELVTMATEDYLPGLRVLANSLRQNAGVDYRLTVLGVAGDVEVDEVIPLIDPPSVTVSLRRLKPTLHKLQAWLLPYESAVWIDADMVCLRSLDGLQYWDGITAVQTLHSIDQPFGHDRSYQRRDRHPWNSGLFSFQPNADCFDELCSMAMQCRLLTFGDQTLLNDYFEDVLYMPISWNFNTLAASLHPALLDGVEPRLIHFAQERKPWRSRCPKGQEQYWAEWNKYA
jgi:alpha-N-acetylglucosamine transferase